MPNDEKYRELDRAVGAQIKREMVAAGVSSYPAVCDGCRGTGMCGTEHCANCAGHGLYELAV